MIKTFIVITFGCRVNQAESRVIGEELGKQGLLETKNQALAEVVVVNSCAVTVKAEKEIRQAIRKIKRENPNCFLIVAGCWVEKIQRSEFKDLVDLFISNKDKDKIGSFFERKLPITFYKDKYAQSAKALVKIQDGCNNYCTYCIVPYLRGRSASRAVDKIVKEIRELEAKKIKEVVLTGVDIADYSDLAGLLREILNKTKIKKISFGSVNINAFTPEFMSLIKDNSQISRHFHIPLQSGCDNTLKRMNRRYKIKNYGSRIMDLKRKIPDFSFSTDIIVGFPGETNKEFEESIRNLRNLRSLLGKKFKKIHIFRYSPREGTVAAKMIGRKDWEEVDNEIKKKRMEEVGRILRSY